MPCAAPYTPRATYHSFPDDLSPDQKNLLLRGISTSYISQIIGTPINPWSPVADFPNGPVRTIECEWLMYNPVLEDWDCASWLFDYDDFDDILGRRSSDN